MKTNIELIQGKMFGYLDERTMLNGLTMDDLKMGNCLRFSESGLTRLASVIGWLDGLHDAGYPFVYKIANDFVRDLIYLSRWGGGEDVKDRLGDREVSVPSNIVLLGDDGTKHGFSILWYRYVKMHSDSFSATKDVSSRKLEREPYMDGNYPVVEYEFYMNGGLICHGPKTRDHLEDMDDVEKNTNGSYNWWGVHT